MNIVVIIKLLLQLVSYFVRKADEEQLKELGRDEVVSQQLKEVASRTHVAKQIIADFADKSDSDINDFLRDYYRD